MPALARISAAERTADQELEAIDRMNAWREQADREARAELLAWIDRANAEPDASAKERERV